MANDWSSAAMRVDYNDAVPSVIAARIAERKREAEEAAVRAAEGGFFIKALNKLAEREEVKSLLAKARRTRRDFADRVRKSTSRGAAAAAGNLRAAAKTQQARAKAEIQKEVEAEGVRALENEMSTMSAGRVKGDNAALKRLRDRQAKYATEKVAKNVTAAVSSEVGGGGGRGRESLPQEDEEEGGSLQGASSEKGVQAARDAIARTEKLQRAHEQKERERRAMTQTALRMAKVKQAAKVQAEARRMAQRKREHLRMERLIEQTRPEEDDEDDRTYEAAAEAYYGGAGSYC